MNIPSLNFRNVLEDRIREVLEPIKYKIMIMSGKGGVGKSLISSYTAVVLAKRGFSVGLLDLDFHGPSSHIFLGLRGIKPTISFKGIDPVEGPLGLKVMSIAFLLQDDEASVIWRGPLKTSAIVQLLTEINWGRLDFLIIDMPPGTGDEAITLAQLAKYIDGAIVVTTPSDITKYVVSRAINFVKSVGIKILGLVENMSYFYCQSNNTVYKIFGESVVEVLSNKFKIPILGKIPIDPELQSYIEKRKILVVENPESHLSHVFEEIVSNLIKTLDKANEATS